MPGSATMTVEVGFEIAGEPTPEQLRQLRSGAEALAHDKQSIVVEWRAKGDRHVVLVRFKMRQLAQYKVVGDIQHQFELSFACHHLFDDFWIAFPREGERPRSKRRT